MPSEKILESKKAKVEKLTETIKSSCAGVLVDYKGITVEEDTKLRKELREAGVTYFVEKNTMLRFAFKNAGFDDLCNVLEGTTALAVSENDQTAPARILGKFAEEHDDKFKQYLRVTRAMAVDMETATLFTCGFSNHIPTGALLLVSDNPMTPDGVKTSDSDRMVTASFVTNHVRIGIQALEMIKQDKKTVRHLKFDY